MFFVFVGQVLVFPKAIRSLAIRADLKSHPQMKHTATGRE